MKTLQAWTKDGSSRQEVYTEYKCNSKKEFKKFMKKKGRIITSEIFIKK